ncbi:tetratricopeptide repeat protein [Thermomonospora cellulosilytica]|uniref:Tetratricopeptide (TPR) repeat protein n=1 Tax=Thermomonospora cellulosilytica TaxID=1411118 RepID=A0A7W3R787_9ACTN|nr:tetratricopeptide repeat protein [Thermomonospora cellulosilytica]MBA9002371.1 tetratricopeptide (TPR) repeat protein [Thermomonospora cellulosilytica]
MSDRLEDPDRLVVDIAEDGSMAVSVWLSGEEQPTPVGERIQVDWPLDAEALEDLRWYLEKYLRLPYGVYSDRGADIAAKLPEWGDALFNAVFSTPELRAAYATVRTRGDRAELVIRSDSARWLGMPWELMRDPERDRPIALDGVAVTRYLPARDLTGSFSVGGERLRALMVISRPAGQRDVGYQMIARPLLERLDAVRGNVDLVVLRPPTLEHLRQVLVEAARNGEPFQIVHFDGHGVFGNGQVPAGWDPSFYQGSVPRGMLVFEKPGGGEDPVPAERVAQVLAEGRVPVVALNACQSGQIGPQVEAAVATRLVRDGAASVVAMAYSVYAVAAAEFMTAFYERLFAGDRVAGAVAAGRRRLALRDERPSPKGKLPLADWMIPVHYQRREVRFPNLRAERTGPLSLDEMLDHYLDPDARPDETSTEDLAPVGTFVGRDNLFYLLESAARLQRVVVLHGPGGTGKTELAKAFGRWWRDTAGVDRPDFVIWHSFEPGVASFGLDGVINNIGLRVFGPRFSLADTDQRRRIIKDLLAKYRLLLIWDNFETVHTLPDPTGATPALDEVARAELKDFLHHVARSGKSSILITSRTPEDWLGDLRRIEVGGLTEDEAIEYADYLLEPYPDTRPRRQGKAFADLMEWLDGHPLSMRLILPQLETTGPAALLSGLRGTTPLPGRGGTDRITSLPASIAYSFTHLPSDHQQALTAVALFHGITDVDVLGLLSQVEGVPAQFHGRATEEWEQILDGAAEVGLLTRLGGGMYRIHPALPAYLTDQWRIHHLTAFTDQYATATRALLDAYAALGHWLLQQIQGGDASLALAVIELHRRNLGNMLGYALDHQHWEHAQHIVQPLDEYWDFRGLTEEAQAWTDRARLALEHPDGTPPDLTTPAGSLWLFLVGSEANRHQQARRLDQAHDIHLTILNALRRQPPSNWQRHHIATATHQLGMVAQDWGDWDEAEEWYRRSLTIKEELGDRPGMATSYHQLGRVAQERGDWDEAEEWYRRSLTIKEELGDRPGMATSYHQLGRVAQDRGDWDEAEEWYRRSLTIKEELGNRPGMAASYHQLGTIAQERGDWDEAEEWYRRSLTIKEELGNRPGMAASYHQLGTIAQERGDWDEAEEWYRRSLTIKEELGNRPGMAASYHQLGTIAQERGDWDEAEEWYRRSLTIDEELGDRLGMAAGYHQLGTIAQERGDWDEAEEWYRRSLTIKEELGDRPGMAASYGQLGLLAEDRGQSAQALESVIRCVALFEEFPHPATGPGPVHLKRLARALGMPALQEAWQRVTGRTLPQAISDFVQQPDP